MDLGKIITIASGKGGTGKTTTTAAVSSCLAAMGHRTLCIDYDSRMKNLDLSLCMADFAVADFGDVQSGRMGLLDACHEHPKIRGLFFLSAPSVITHITQEDTDDEKPMTMFLNCKRFFDFCLIDAPSGIGEGFRKAHLAADMSVIVTTGELPSIRDAQRTAEAARGAGVGEVRLLINRVNGKTFRRLRVDADGIIDSVCARLIGIVREDASVPLSLHDNTPLILYRKRRAAYDFLDTARRITGEDLPLRRAVAV